MVGNRLHVESQVLLRWASRSGCATPACPCVVTLHCRRQLISPKISSNLNSFHDFNCFRFEQSYICLRQPTAVVPAFHIAIYCHWICPTVLFFLYFPPSVPLFPNCAIAPVPCGSCSWNPFSSYHANIPGLSPMQLAVGSSIHSCRAKCFDPWGLGQQSFLLVHFEPYI